MNQQTSRRVPEPENVDQLRARIDEGATRDKVAARDPAAAPLGTDDEAAGRGLDREEIRADWNDAGVDVEHKARPAGASRAWISVALVIVAALVIAALLFGM